MLGSQARAKAAWRAQAGLVAGPPLMWRRAPVKASRRFTWRTPTAKGRCVLGRIRRGGATTKGAGGGSTSFSTSVEARVKNKKKGLGSMLLVCAMIQISCLLSSVFLTSGGVSSSEEQRWLCVKSASFCTAAAEMPSTAATPRTEQGVVDEARAESGC